MYRLLPLFTVYSKQREPAFFLYFLWLILPVSMLSCRRTPGLSEFTRQGYYLVTAKELFQRGTLYLDAGNDSVSIIARQLISLGREHNDTMVIVNGKLLQVNHAWKSSNYKEAMKMALETLSDAQKAGLKEKIPVLYAVIGHLYKENENYPSAIPMAEKEVKAAEAIKDTDLIIGAILNLGMFTHSYGMQKNDSALQAKALPLYLKGLEMAESSPKYERGRIPFYDDLSQYYKLFGDYDKGIYYGRKGAALAKKYHQVSSLTYAYNWLGEIYFYQGFHQKGIAYLNKALRAAVSIKNAFREMEINGSLHRCYHSIGDDKNALKYFHRAMRIRDSLQVEQNVEAISQLHIQYETGKKDAQIASLAAINKERNKRSIFILAGLLVFAVLSVFLFFQSGTIRRRNRLLLESNRTVQEQAEQLKTLMKELHHRVKNNLQIVSSLLSLQSNHLEDKDAQRAVRIGQQRIEAMSLIHRSLYRQDDPNMVNMREYVSDLVESILQSFGVDKSKFYLHLEVGITEMDVDTALPLGLIINEWVTNACKYAYKDIDRPALYLSLNKRVKIMLEIRDNGQGMSREAWERPRGSFGIKLVKALSKQLNGVCEMKNGNGTALVMEIPGKRRKEAG